MLNVDNPFHCDQAMYLLDTNVISELRRPRPHDAVLKWIRPIASADLHLCAVTIGEIQAGIELARAQDRSKALEIKAWLEAVVDSYPVLPMDGKAFRQWARFMHGKSETLYEDAMIAVIAMVNGLVVVTRNTSDFKAFGVKTLNPFNTKP